MSSDFYEFGRRGRELLAGTDFLRERQTSAKFQISIEPSFDPHTTITVYWKEFGYGVLILTWDMMRELKRAATSSVPVDPIVEQHTIPIDYWYIESTVRRFNNVRIPLRVQKDSSGCDGTIYQFYLNENTYDFRCTWWENSPEEWTPLYKIVHDVIDHVKELFIKHKMRQLLEQYTEILKSGAYPQEAKLIFQVSSTGEKTEFIEVFKFSYIVSFAVTCELDFYLVRYSESSIIKKIAPVENQYIDNLFGQLANTIQNHSVPMIPDAPVYELHVDDRHTKASYKWHYTAEWHPFFSPLQQTVADIKKIAKKVD